MTQLKQISSGIQQKLSVADASNITLAGGTTYDVTVKYEAADAVPATSDANTFKTSGDPDGYSSAVVPTSINNARKIANVKKIACPTIPSNC